MILKRNIFKLGILQIYLPVLYLNTFREFDLSQLKIRSCKTTPDTSSIILTTVPSSYPLLIQFNTVADGEDVLGD